MTPRLARGASGRRRRFFAVFRPRAGRGDPGERVRLPALAATLEAIADDGFDAFYDGRPRRSGRHAGWPRPARRSRAADLAAPHRRPGPSRSAIDYRGRPGDDPPAEQLGDRRARAAGDPGQLRAAAGRGVRPGRRHRPRLDPPRDRGGQAGHGRPRRAPDRSGVPRRPGRRAARPGPRRGAGRPDRPASGRPAGRRDQPVGWRHGLPGRRRRRRATPSASSSRCYANFGSGVLDPDTGILYQNRGSYFSLDPDHPNVLEPGKRTLHTLLPGMLFRDGAAEPWVVAGAMGGDAQPQIHAQLVSALVDGGVDIRTAVAAPRWFVEPAAHFAAAGRGPARGPSRARRRRGARGARPSRDHPPRRSIRGSARSTPSSSSAADRRPRTDRSRPPPTPAATGLPAAW